VSDPERCEICNVPLTNSAELDAALRLRDPGAPFLHLRDRKNPRPRCLSHGDTPLPTGGEIKRRGRGWGNV
jgi:hypothetical protein